MAANAGEVRARLVLDNDNFNRNMQTAQRDMQSLSQNSRILAKDMGVIKNASMGLGVAVVGAVGASVAAAANFEQGMARVKAISGATEAEFAALSGIAQEMGSTTQFSATQAADALGYLSMAGFKANQSVEALPSVLDLAAAAQVDLGRSADIVSNIMTGFGIKAEDTGKAVDVLVKTMTTANTDLNMLGEGMKYVAPVAASLGFSIEETAAAVAKMSDAGIQGSQAGTALRAALLSLNNPVGQAEEAMKALGINVKDANGEMLSLPKIVGEVADSMDGLTDAQKTQYAAQLVGTEAASGFIALMKVGEEGLQDYTTALENSGGTAERVAKVQMDTMKGALTEMQSALEGLGISIGNEFLPALTELVRKGTEFVGWLNDVDPKVLSMTLKMAGATAGVGLMSVGIYKAVKAMKALRLAFISNPIGLAITGVSLLAGALVGMADAQENAKTVTLEHYNELSKQQTKVDDTITTFENLRSRLRLTNDQFLEYLDTQKELQNTTDVTKIEELNKKLDFLQKNSGLSKDEMNKLVQANADLIEQAPQTETAVSKTGEAMAKNADAAKAVNKELLEQKRLELELQEAKLIANVDEHVRDYQKAVEDVNTALEKRNQGYIDEQALMYNISELNKKKVEANKLEGGQREAALLQIDQEIDRNEFLLHGQQEQNVKLSEKYLKQRDNLKAADDVLTKDKEIYSQINQNILAEVGLTAEVGKEKAAIDEAIRAQQKKKDEIIKNAGGVENLNGKQKNEIKLIDDAIGKFKAAGGQIDINSEKQKGTNDKIKKGVGDAEDLTKELSRDAAKNVKFKGDGMTKAEQITDELGKPVTKKVTIWETVKKTVAGWFGGGDSKRHNGGHLQGMRPKYHTGGSPAFNDPRAPKFNEVDVRLLKDEMVLTGKQQERLWNMVRTFNVASAKYLKQQGGEQGTAISKGDTQINIAALHVREEADVKKIAQELDRLETQRKRARG